jgi:hypothetical protein
MWLKSVKTYRRYWFEIHLRSDVKYGWHWADFQGITCRYFKRLLYQVQQKMQNMQAKLIYALKDRTA